MLKEKKIERSTSDFLDAPGYDYLPIKKKKKKIYLKKTSRKACDLAGKARIRRDFKA